MSGNDIKHALSYFVAYDKNSKKRQVMLPQISDETMSSFENPKQWTENEVHLCYPRKIDQIIKNAIFIAHHIG